MKGHSWFMRLWRRVSGYIAEIKVLNSVIIRTVPNILNPYGVISLTGRWILTVSVRRHTKLYLTSMKC